MSPRTSEPDGSVRAVAVPSSDNSIGRPVADNLSPVTTSSQQPLVGRTVTDDQLTPASLRRLACDAEILPAVMGTASAPLDLGRTTRLASPAQLLALWHRDRGCTQPG